MCSDHTAASRQCMVLSNRQIAREIFHMALRAPSGMLAGFVPGQFAHVAIPADNSLLLRRPISIHRVQGDIFELIYRTVGRGTRALAACAPSSPLDVLAPLGNGFALPPKGSRVWLVGGGMGAAPLASLPGGRDYTAFLGFQSASHAFGIDTFDALCGAQFVATDDGTLGQAGRVTDLVAQALRHHSPDVVLACGPTPMLCALKALLGESIVPVQASLEQRMGCGTGGCYTCICSVAGKNARVCTDGPVFNLREVEL